MRLARVDNSRLRRYLFKMIYGVVDLFVPYHLFFVRRLLLRIFGANIHKNCRIYNNVKVFDPKNLQMHEGSTIGPSVIIYNVARIRLLKNATISQYSHLCSASHNYKSRLHELICDDIVIGKNAWVASDVFVGPGVSFGNNAVALARSVVIKAVGPNEVVAGNPAKVVGARFD